MLIILYNLNIITQLKVYVHAICDHLDDRLLLLSLNYNLLYCFPMHKRDMHDQIDRNSKTPKLTHILEALREVLLL